MYQEEDSELVCQSGTLTYTATSRSPTITICPYVARSLGWVRSSASPFVLINASGEIIAQTICWIGRHKPKRGGLTTPEGLRDRTGGTYKSRRKSRNLKADTGHSSVGATVERNVIDESRGAGTRTVVRDDPNKQLLLSKTDIPGRSHWICWTVHSSKLATTPVSGGLFRYWECQQCILCCNGKQLIAAMQTSLLWTGIWYT